MLDRPPSGQIEGRGTEVPDPRLPPLRPYHPVTFLERGIAVPFTSPMLGGTRARKRETGGLELVIPNPSGGRGVYIMGWTGISALCTPTLHDRKLSDRIATLTDVTPDTVRQAAREVAARGLAGEEAMQAAHDAAQREIAERLVANYLLLVNLIAQVNHRPVPQQTAGPMDLELLEHRARATVSKVAPMLQRSTHWVASALEQIAGAMIGIGLDPRASTSRLPRLVERLQCCSTEIVQWSLRQPSDDRAGYAEMVCGIADFTISLARVTIGQARALTKDLVGLLRSWSTDPVTTMRLAARPEWLLDGWEQICLVWHLAEDDAERRAALVEMAQIIPVLPKEVRDWSDIVWEADVPPHLRRLVTLSEDWRSGSTVFELTARNERLRAAAC
jgi:hypothetical protein